MIAPEMPSEPGTTSTSTIDIVPVQEAFSLFTRRSPTTDRPRIQAKVGPSAVQIAHAHSVKTASGDRGANSRRVVRTSRHGPTRHSVALVTALVIVIRSGGRELGCSAPCKSQPQKKKRPDCSAGSFLFGAYPIANAGAACHDADENHQIVRGRSSSRSQ